MTTDEKMMALIDEIFDDFENMSCKACKFYYPTNERDVGIDICEQKELYQYSRDEDTVAPFQPPNETFSCPYFERKH